MKFTVLRPTEMDMTWLDVYPGYRFYPEDIGIGDEKFEDWGEIKEKYPTLFDKTNDEFVLRIQLDSGHIYNWPENVTGNFRSVKVVDDGEYILRDEDLHELKRHNYCYVPECLQIEDNGYGDYFEFTVDERGFINNWKFTQKDVDEIFEVEDED